MTSKPTAAPAVWPYPGHRTMAEVIEEQAMMARGSVRLREAVLTTKWCSNLGRRRA